MTSTARRDVLVAVAVALGATAAVLLLIGGRSSAGAADDPMANGRDLFVTGCSSCHGIDGRGITTSEGTRRGPDLTNAGEAGAYYELSTGRMPLADSSDTPARARPSYDEAQIADLVLYVGSLGHGPALPKVDVANADLALGGEEFRASCAPCHSAAGAGGALSYGRAAPSLAQAEPLQVGAAVRSGPGPMPVFGEDVINQTELNAVAAYVQYLRHPDDRGGLPIGSTGPVPEGFVALTFGIGSLLAMVAWIGTRSPVRRRRRGAHDA